jgi:hypothetical protein
VLRALGVTALIPRSFSIEAKPMCTEKVEQEFLLDKFVLGVPGTLGCLDEH